jgi:hypothetical protein
MGIVTEKQFLTSEELNGLKEIQQNTESLILELGEIELRKIQLAERYENAKEFLDGLKSAEKNMYNTFSEKYGKVSINPETGEITKID